MDYVTKRNGEKGTFDAEKINKILAWATEGITGVSSSDVAMNSQIQFFPGIRTSQIHNVLIQSAVDLISEKTPNYQYVAANLLNYLLRKEVFESKLDTMPHLYTVIMKNVEAGVYDSIILEKYTPEEISVLSIYMKHKRDHDFTYAGLQQLMDKYLIKDRSTGKIFETPQYAFMLIAMTVFMDYDTDNRLGHVKELYDLISTQKISLPTPIMAGIRTPNRQYSSCFPAGQSVFTNKGFKNIEDINIDDYVITVGNIENKVLATRSKMYTGNLHHINTYYSIKDEFTSTEDHLIRVIKREDVKCIKDASRKCPIHNGKLKVCHKTSGISANECNLLDKYSGKLQWVEAKDVRKNDFIQVPYFSNVIDTDSIKISDLITLPEHYIVNDGKIVKQTHDSSGRNRHGDFNDHITPITDEIEFDNDFFRLMGYYLAEGWSSSELYSTTFTFHEDEIEYLEDVKNILSKKFGVNVAIRQHTTDKSKYVQVNGKILPLFFEQLCGKYSSNKKMHDWLMYASPSKQLHLLKGLILGDGCATKQGLLLQLSNKSLILQCAQIALRNKLYPSLSKCTPKNKDFANRQISYRIDFNKTANYAFIEFVNKNIENTSTSKHKSYPNGFWYNDMFFTKVKLNTIETVSNIEVFDLQVKKNESFVVNGLGVHNCVLIEVEDSLDSIFHSNTAIGQYVAKRAGIGINAGSIRAEGSKIRNGEVVHTGVIPFFRMFQSTLHSCSQGGIRKGSATLHFPFWHKEIEDVLVLKNNKGTDDNRVRHIDYSIQFSRLFYQRFLKNESISLFSPHDVPGLYEAFGFNDKFDELYVRYEKDKKIPRKTVKARDLMNAFAQERIGTGRMYVMNIDNVNSNSPFSIQLRQSNLCLTGDNYLNDVLIDGVLHKKILLSELLEIFDDSRDFQILSKNLDTNELEFKKIERAWTTKKDAEIYEIEDTDTGVKVRCTGDHLIYTKNRGWVEAQYLKEDDQLDYLL
jgi:intein/homing endonuclease